MTDPAMSSLDATPVGVAWYALQVRTTHERRVAQLLAQKGFEHFLPTYRVRRRWSDRVKEVDQPLFPGYLFCRFDAHTRVPILKTEGVARIVGVGAVPMPIEESEILGIQQAVGSGLDVRPHVYLATGQRVRIESGPFEGVEGLIVEIRKRHRLVLAINLLQRAMSVEIDRAWVVPVSPRPSRLLQPAAGD